MTKEIKLIVLDLMYDNGNSEVIAVTPKQWAGRLRRKDYRKTIISKKVQASVSIKIKTKQNGKN